jgi:hypothetical protein
MDTLKPHASWKMRETCNLNILFAKCIRLRNGLSAQLWQLLQQQLHRQFVKERLPVPLFDIRPSFSTRKRPSQHSCFRLTLPPNSCTRKLLLFDARPELPMFVLQFDAPRPELLYKMSALPTVPLPFFDTRPELLCNMDAVLMLHPFNTRRLKILQREQQLNLDKKARSQKPRLHRLEQVGELLTILKTRIFSLHVPTST